MSSTFSAPMHQCSLDSPAERSIPKLSRSSCSTYDTLVITIFHSSISWQLFQSHIQSDIAKKKRWKWKGSGTWKCTINPIFEEGLQRPPSRFFRVKLIEYLRFGTIPDFSLRIGWCTFWKIVKQNRLQDPFYGEDLAFFYLNAPLNASNAC